MHIDCGYILWRVELTMEMRKFENFGPNFYLFGPRWAFRVTFGRGGWETAAPMRNSATPQTTSKLLAPAVIGGGGGGQVEMLLLYEFS
jgi:hypothetical protein